MLENEAALQWAEKQDKSQLMNGKVNCPGYFYLRTNTLRTRLVKLFLGYLYKLL